MSAFTRKELRTKCSGNSVQATQGGGADPKTAYPRELLVLETGLPRPEGANTQSPKGWMRCTGHRPQPELPASSWSGGGEENVHS